MQTRQGPQADQVSWTEPCDAEDDTVGAAFP
jgi:hypothetical protein